MKRNLIKSLTMPGLLVFSLLLTGCASAGSSPSAETSEESTNENTITVTDARGEVEIPADPKRIVDISGNSDILSILGYSVVGTANSDAYDYTKFPSYLEHVLEGSTILGYSMQDTMDLEAILSLEPDLIILSSVQESMYEQLQEVAPTVMIELAQIDWTEDLMDAAAIFDKKEAADKWLEDYQKEAARIGEQIRKDYGEDTTYLAFLASGGSLFVFDAAGAGGVLYDDMKLAKPQGMPEQTDISLPVVTYEGLAAIDADYIFAIGADQDLEELRGSKIWNGIPAVQEGKVKELPASPYFNMGYSPIGRSLLIEEIPRLLESMNE